MGRLVLVLCLFAALPACSSDETLTAYGAADTEWRLIQIDGNDFQATASIRFSPAGAVTGQAPCNRFNAVQTAPYPWFALDKVAITRRACPDLAQENAFMTALEQMTLAETAPGTLLLSNEAGREMLFHAAE
ncbi:META domain-containing protein [Rhodobacteraceae bacterium KMM 6894]|nr:META domain-containing protein [Rhodobacteraceae bacterium KMM 6894]